MDVTTSPTSSKAQKFSAGQDASEDDDLISRLPDDILIRVVLFISTKEAVRTSILSKRWRYLWPSVPSLIFSDYSLVRSRTKSHEQILELKASLCRSIERALGLRNASCLRRLALYLNNTQVRAFRVQSWVSAAVKHEVQKLIVRLPKKGRFVLPSNLFTSKSLTGFWLEMHCTLEVPSFICFSGLKCLTLDNVVFQDDRSAQQLFSGCPILEYLSLHDCGWKNITGITIEIPTLKSLTFLDHSYFSDFRPIFKIMISALILETLRVCSNQIVEVLICILPSLNSASIDIWNHGEAEQIRNIIELLSGIQNVKSLKVSNQTLEPLLLAENPLMHLPTFYNLICLQAYVDLSTYDGACISGALVYILQKSPNLGCLNLPRVFKPQDQSMILGTVPSCFQSSLKLFIIQDFDGDADELCLLKYAYEKAPVLERLVINCSPGLLEDLKKQEEISHQLRQLRGLSAGCMIEFCPSEFSQKLWAL